MREIRIGKNAVKKALPQKLKPYQSLSMFKNEQELNDQAEKMRKQGKEVIIQTKPTLKLLYR